ncbi:MAG: hypothetical protein ACRD2D_03870, partial [Terriglobales bacterium]
ALCAGAAAQMPQMSMTDHARTDHAGSDHAGSGTSLEPSSTPVPMLMTTRDGWTLMAHGAGFLADQQQSGARGADKLYSPNWAMFMAERRWGPGELTLRSMFSLEPATITDQRYPELFQTGETAFGRPIVDGQHPHNFFMELAALYDVSLGEEGGLEIYAAPIGDPALGPEAFPHRESAAFDPLAPLGHHRQDSTHIAASVVTVGAKYGPARIEFSGFHGREPGENRWVFLTGAIDSWSTRFSLSPTPDWTGQVSWGKLHSPEALNPLEDQIRMTASVNYNRKLAGGNWASLLLWGRTRDAAGGNVFNSYLLESNLGLGRNHVWTRIENVDKSTELELEQAAEPPGFVERFLARIQAYSLGYARDLPSPDWLPTSLGAQWTLYQAPDFLHGIYANHPQGIAVFLRVRLGRY